MPTNPREVARDAALALLRALAALPAGPALRVTEAEGNLACLLQVWDARRLMPTAGDGRRAPQKGRRSGCKSDILAAVREAGRPLTRKLLVRMMKDGRKGHGEGTVAKALAELTKAGELVNTRDKCGYRLPEWPRRRETPSLFE